MKYLKKYENLETMQTTLTTGDIVKCIDNFGAKLLTPNKIYTISVVIIDINCYYRLEELIDNDCIFRSSRFILATPEEIKQYKLEKTTDKFNL